MVQADRGSPRQERVMMQYCDVQDAAEYVNVSGGSRPESRFRRSRLQLVKSVLGSCPGGDLLDAGCGPGEMVHALLESRPNDFRIAAFDQSQAMVDYCRTWTHNMGAVYPAVGRLEAMPFADATFDVALALGVLEYTDIRSAIGEISRVTRQGGLIIVTMLNSLSPYRLTEWFLCWPLIRLVGLIEKSCHVPASRRHGASLSGIRAYPMFLVRRLMRQAKLQPIDIFYFDVNWVVPPFDRLASVIRKAERTPQERTVTRGWRRWMGTAYLIVAKRS
jgi:SAM-dependent methyltransferase